MTPPSVDFATKRSRLPLSGQNTNTSPFAFVLMSPPMPVPVVSEPLTCNGVPQVPPGPTRLDTKTGLPLCQIRYMLSLNGEFAL